MDRDRYEQEMHRARTLRMAATEHRDVEYWNGYIKGLTRAYLGENLLTEEEHRRYSDLSNSRNPVVQQRGKGYEDGFKALKNIKHRRNHE